MTPPEINVWADMASRVSFQPRIHDPYFLDEEPVKKEKKRRKAKRKVKPRFEFVAAPGQRRFA